MPTEKPDYDVVIIDHPPSHTKAPESAFVLLPMQPSAIDYASYEKSRFLLFGKSYLPIVNAVDNRIRDDKEMSDLVTRGGGFSINRRSIYRRCYGENKTVFEMENKYGASPARQEFKRLMGVINERLA